MKITLLTNNSGGNSVIKMSGIARYTRCLYEELNREKTKKNQSKLFSQEIVLLETPAPPHWLIFLGKILGKDIATVFKGTPLQFPKQTNNNEIVHCTSQTLAIPLLYAKKKGVKYVVTVHDLIPDATNCYASITEKILYFFILKALRKADYLLADSAHTKKDIIKYVRYPENKIIVIPPGINHTEFHENHDKKRKTKTRRELETILYVGSEHKRKNIELIIKAFSLVAKEIPNIKFVKVGQAQDQTNRKQLLLLAKQLSVEEKIIWKEYTDDLAQEYNTATVFVFPSLYEGFGFPVLEAMACGCPVITTNRTSLSELTGDAALLCDPFNEKDLAEKIIEVITNKKLQQQLRKKGLEQAKKFSWKRCGEKTMKVYDSLNHLTKSLHELAT